MRVYRDSDDELWHETPDGKFLCAHTPKEMSRLLRVGLKGTPFHKLNYTYGPLTLVRSDDR